MSGLERSATTWTRIWSPGLPATRAAAFLLTLSAVCLAGVAELLAIFATPIAGAIAYGSLACGLGAYSALTAVAAGAGQHLRRLSLALLAVAVLRVISLAVPVESLVPVIWLAVAGLAGLVAAAALFWTAGSTLHEVGLRWPASWLDPALVPLGLALGYAGHLYIEPTPLVGDVDPIRIVGYGVVLIVCSALVEELLFRGFLQPSLTALFGWAGVLWTACLFALVYAGSQSPVGVLLALVAGLLFGFARFHAGSLWGPFGAHATMTVSMLVIFPALS